MAKKSVLILAALAALCGLLSLGSSPALAQEGAAIEGVWTVNVTWLPGIPSDPAEWTITQMGPLFKIVVTGSEATGLGFTLGTLVFARVNGDCLSLHLGVAAPGTMQGFVFCVDQTGIGFWNAALN